MISKRIISFVGISGVGKTTFAQSYNPGDYFHYSVDYAISLLIEKDIKKSLNLESDHDLKFKVSDLKERFFYATDCNLQEIFFKGGKLNLVRCPKRGLVIFWGEDSA